MPDRIATSLLRLSRDPATGRPRRPYRVDIGLRAASFCDLALTGRLTTVLRAPEVADETPTGDRVLDAVHSTVARRPGILWLRWYRHVHDDRVALTKELVESGRWRRSGGMRASFTESDPDGVAELARHIEAVIEGRGDPADPQEAVLALLAAMCGALGPKPRPRVHVEGLGRLLDAVGDQDDVDDQRRDAVREAVDAASARLQRPRRMGSLAKRPRHKGVG